MSDADVRIRIRQLRIDPALSQGMSAAQLQAAVQAALADRLLGSGVAAPREWGVSTAVADAVADRVRPAMGGGSR